MKIDFHHILLVAAMGLLICTSASAQQTDPRLTASNPAGLSWLQESSRAEVVLNSTAEEGGYVNYNGAGKSIDFGAGTAAFVRFSPKVALHGSLSYANFTGFNMGGSVLMDPDDAPFNMVEYSDKYKGTKKREDYNLTGSVAVTLSDRWRLGARIEYIASNFSKLKDLRHSNTGMDMKLSAGAEFLATDRIGIGLSYTYRDRLENIIFQTYGTKDVTYYTLVDYGLFYGMTESAGESGYTELNNRTPIVDDIHTAALQLNFYPSKSTIILNDFHASYREGFYGINTSSKILFTSHQQVAFGYRGDILFGRNSRQSMTLFADLSSLKNSRNNYRLSTKDNITTVEYFGSNLVQNRVEVKGGLDWRGSFGLTSDPLAKWNGYAGVNGRLRSIETNIYPFYRRQNLLILDAEVGAERNFVSRANVFTPSLGAIAHGGMGELKRDGLTATPSDKSEAPKSMDLYLEREHAYLTSPAMGGTLGFRYMRRIKMDFAPYLRLDWTMMHLLSSETALEGQNRNRVSITFGLLF